MIKANYLKNCFSSVSPKALMLTALVTVFAANSADAQLSNIFKKKNKDKTEQPVSTPSARQVQEKQPWDNDTLYIEAKKRIEADDLRKLKDAEDTKTRDSTAAALNRSTRLGFVDRDEANRWIDLDKRNAARAEYLRARNDFLAARNLINNEYERRLSEIRNNYNDQVRAVDASHDSQIAALNKQFANKEPYKTQAAQKAKENSPLPQQVVAPKKDEADLAKERMDKKRQQYLEQQYDKYLKSLPSGTAPVTPEEFLKSLEVNSSANKEGADVVTVTAFTAQDSLYYKNYLLCFPAGADEEKQKLTFEQFSSAYTAEQRKSYTDYLAGLSSEQMPVNSLEYFKAYNSSQGAKQVVAPQKKLDKKPGGAP